MTQRERILAVSVAGLIAVTGGVALVRARIIRPLQNKHQTLAALQAQREELLLRLRHEAEAQEGWRRKTAATLHASLFEASQLFRQDMERVLERSGLANRTVRLLSPSREAKGMREGFTALRVSATGEGTLAQVVAFLREFYERPYLTRITKLTLSTPEQIRTGARPSPRARRDAAATGDEPKISVKFEAAALVLPELAGVPHTPLDPNRPEREGIRPLIDVGDEKYDEIVQANLFKLYQPPPPAVVQTEPNDRPPPADTPPRPPPPNPYDKMVLVATTAHEGDLVAWVRDDARPTEPPRHFRLNESVHDGRLVLVHPLGMVVRVHKAGESGAATGAAAGSAIVDYFYEPGKSFKERVPLDPVDHAEIARELQLVFGG
jgi:hypothetical protein